MPGDFMVGGHFYRAGKMDAFTQQKCVKRVAPLLEALPSLLSAIGGDGDMSSLGAIGKVVSTIPDEDLDFLQRKALAVTQRKESGGTGYANVWVDGPDGGRSMYADIGGPEMLIITMFVLKENLLPFFHGLVSALPGMVGAALPSTQPGSTTSPTI